MATFTWYGQNPSGAVVINAANRLGFANYAGTYPTPAQYGPVTVGAYPNLTYHASGSTGAPSGSGTWALYGFYATKYDGGSGLTWYKPDLSTSTVYANTYVPSGSVPVKIAFSHATPVATQNAQFWAYDGTSSTANPTNVTVYAFQAESGSWANVTPGSPLSLTDQTTSDIVHYYFLGISATPTAAGAQTALGFWMSLEYY
jgi:hypothetical protein